MQRCKTLLSVLGFLLLTPTFTRAEAPPSKPITAVVALGDADKEEVRRFAEALVAASAPVMSPENISRRLRAVALDCDPSTATGDCYRPPDEVALEAKLREAQALEGYFKTAQANALRIEVLQTYQQTPIPSVKLHELAGNSLLGRASGQYAEGKADEAMQLAREFSRHFGSIAIDPGLYSPPLQRIFAKAKQAAIREANLEIKVRTTMAGELWADGNDLGRIDGEASVRLAPGTYRLWVRLDTRRASFPVEINVSKATLPLTVELDPALDERVQCQDPIRLTCENSACEPLAGRLRQRLGVPRLIGFNPGPSKAPQALLIESDGAARWLSLAELGPALGAEKLHIAAPVEATAAPQASVLPSWMRREWLAIASASAGVVALGTAIVLGARSRSQLDQAKDTGLPQTENDELNSKGHTNAILANVLFGVAALGVGGGAVLYFYADF